MNRTTAVSVLAAAALLAGGAQIGAVAATGAPLLLGKVNKASKTTTIKVTGKQPALRLKTKKTVPPLAVTSSAKVNRLNADLLDGKDSGELGTAAYTFALPTGGTPAANTRSSFPGLPSGTYLATYSVYGAGSTDLTCYFRANTLSPAATRTAYSHGDDTASGSGVVVVPSAPSLPDYFACESASPFTFGASGISFSQQSTVTFLRLDSNTAGTTGP